MADLLPSVGHIPLAWVMGYDTRPLLTMKEKDAFLQQAAQKEYILFFEQVPLHVSEQRWIRLMYAPQEYLVIFMTIVTFN